MREHWKKIRGWPYEVSDRGRVRSIKREIKYQRPDSKITVIKRTVRERILKPGISKKGYEIVTFTKGTHTRGYLYVHHLVLAAFVGPLPKGLETRHLNGKPADNRLRNLKYGTSKENGEDMSKHRRNK